MHEAVWVQVTAVRWLADQHGAVSASPAASRPVEQAQQTSSVVWDASVALLHALGFLVSEEGAEAAAVAATSIACTGESAVGAATVTEALRARGSGRAAAHSCCESEATAG